MTDDIAHIARRLERIEDELTQVDGMEQFRERISQIRMDLVDVGLEKARENATVIDEYDELERRVEDTDLIVPILESSQETRSFTCAWCGDDIDGAAMLPERAEYPLHTECWRKWVSEQ